MNESSAPDSDAEALRKAADAAFQRGDLDTAAATYRKAIDADPGQFKAHNNLGLLLQRRGDLEGAVRSFAAAADLSPDNPAILSNQGAALVALMRYGEAIAVLDKAVSFEPAHPGAQYNLALALLGDRRPQDALEHARAATDLSPDRAEAWVTLGNALTALHDHAAAESAYRQALTRNAGIAEVHLNLARSLLRRGDLEGAAGHAESAVAIAPESAVAYFTRANVAARQPDFASAVDAYERALDLKPDYLEAAINLSNVLRQLGRFDEAAAAIERSLALDPSETNADSNRLLIAQYDPSKNAADLSAMHRAWAERHTPAQTSDPFLNGRDPDRTIQVGLVSPNFARHPVGFFVAPVLAHHDRQSVHITCYSDADGRDAMTEILEAAADNWVPIHAMSDAALAARLRADGIDIAIDLAGHTAHNRMPAFARRVAPVQATWAGYVGTTGLAAMDYLITDAPQTPASDQPLMTEQPVRLPGNYVPYAVPDEAPAVGPLPCAANGAVTFGCFNNRDKLNDRVIEVWSRILGRVPDARLMLVTFALGDPLVAAAIRETFARHGIAADRLIISGKKPFAELLASYNAIDIALDPFPYSGGLTTIEALMMGVPVITRGDGDRFAGRHSVAHLTACGVTELIAANEDAYVDCAVALAGDRERLAALRAGLRDRLLASPICDGAGYTRSWERALRAMWRQWCLGRPPAAIGPDGL